MVTVSTDTWDKRVSKRPSMLELLNSRVKMYMVKVTFGATDTLTGGKISVDLKGGGKIKDYMAVIPFHVPNGHVAYYDITTGQFSIYEGGSAGTPLALKNENTNLPSIVIDCLVIGV